MLSQQQELSPEQEQLLIAIKGKRDEEVKTLHMKINDFNYKDNDGKSPLHYATEFENIYALKLLIAKKPNLDIQDKNLNTPLHLAAFKLLDDYSALLIEAKANVELQNQDGNTVLHLLANRGPNGGKALLGKFEKLLEPSIYVKNKANLTPLHCCILSDNMPMYTFYIDHLRRRYYGQIDLNHQNFINETNGDGLAHTIIRRLQHGNKWPDNEARTYQMLYLLAAMNPASFNIRNKIGTLRGDTPLELIHQFPNFASPRLVNLLQHPVETHSDLFSLKLCIGVLQESVNRLGMENDSLKTKLADTKTIETELKTELNDVKGQLTLLAELLNQRFNLEEPKSNSQLQNN